MGGGLENEKRSCAVVTQGNSGRGNIFPVSRGWHSMSMGGLGMDIGDDEKENGYAGKKETYTTELGCGTRGGRFLPYGTPAGTSHIHRLNRKRRGKDTQQCVSNPAARTLHDLLDIDRSYNNN